MSRFVTKGLRGQEATWAALLTCGCIILIVDDNFITRPCSVKCPNFLELHDMAAGMKKEHITRWIGKNREH
jgi:hypothetical protein